MTSPSKVYIIKRNGKRYNSKKFSSYDEARNYVRRLMSKKFGYIDNISFAGFSISAK